MHTHFLILKWVRFEIGKKRRFKVRWIPWSACHIPAFTSAGNITFVSVDEITNININELKIPIVWILF